MPDQNVDAAIAVTRFGLGARRGEIEIGEFRSAGFFEVSDPPRRRGTARSLIHQHNSNPHQNV